MPVVTVIMSAYNTSKYVGKAIESILGQTFTDFEFLIVDNGSTDETGSVVDHYVAKDKRIRVFHNEGNVELPQALNFCLKQAKGTYLYVIDSDDWATPEMLEKMINRAEHHDAQLVYTGFFMDHQLKEKAYNFVVIPADADYTRQEFRENAINDLARMFLHVYWNKLYRIDYFQKHGIEFPNTKLFDLHFNLEVIKDIERVSVIGEPLYHYIRAREGSYMASNPYLNQKKREHFAHMVEIYQYWGISNQETKSKLAGIHLGNLVRCITETVTGSNPREYKRKELKTIFDDKWTKFAIENCPKGLKNKIFCVLVKSRCVGLCNMAGWSIYTLQQLLPGIYYSLRASVAQKGAVREKNS